MRKTYTNPIAKQGDFADPFILRHDGRYYLYATNPDVRCWVSDHLVDWTLCGAAVTADEFPELVPFAPEVIYHNGFFYMYTSPHGCGHYVLRSTSPTGPFRKITENIGHAIDFSIFVDEDGRWYAYWADDEGILGCEMTSPTTFGEPKHVGAYLHGWTEGPFIVKADGRYHLTYTGNHYLSKGYRIHAAVSDHPLGPYRDVADNPVIVRTQGEVVGLGHSSTVLGPNLLSEYIAYHNLNPDRTRDLNIDEVIFEPEGMIVLGPTCCARPVPAMPDACCRGEWLIPGELAACGALEMNMTASDQTAAYGAQLGDAKVILCKEENHLTVSLGDQMLASYALPKAFCHEALHRLYLRWSEENCRIWMDALLVYEGKLPLCGAKVSFTGDGLLPGYAAHTKEAVCELALPCRIPKNRKTILRLHENAVCLLSWNSAEENACFVVDGKMCAADAGGFGCKTVAFPAGKHELTAHGLCGAAIMIQSKPVNEERAAWHHMGPFAKQTLTECMMDAEISAALQVEPCDPDWEAGILLRADHLANGGEGDDPVLGKNFMVGYRIALNANGMTLYRHRYDCVQLAHTSVTSQRLSISLRGNIIAVYANEQRVITYEDPEPIISGRMGFDARKCYLDGEMICTPVQ